MIQVTLTEALAHLPELLTAARKGEAIAIEQEDGWSYRLTAVPPRMRPPVTGIPKAGRFKGQLVAPDDFDEPLEELREYME
jgi:antitoxin (DNA-binding transcriptional repressor) of toxin-antitoxin stability system